ncbi:uncharacterized protein LOC131243948 [Magnolia sinica]|uniref:uncharacterized protein LOC131243948 n=1 Tax=Magnolia sinica TaxID=86752 RepID=UPI00265AA0C9|nr:uncharacterized protein LOC131243948 [Magnolia sinica]
MDLSYLHVFIGSLKSPPLYFSLLIIHSNKQEKGKEMNTLKATQTSFPPKNPSFLCPRKLPKRKTSTISFCSNSSSGAESEPSPPEEGGDKSKQELLAKIAMLQTQKVRLTDYLDERSAYLTQFAEDANAEFDAIGEDALKGLDDAEARIMGNIESRMQAFEEKSESSKQEIEKSEQKVVDFEDQMENDQNEGLFFKNLGQRKPQERVEAQEEMQKLRVTKENAGSKIRRNIYLALICLLAATIVNAIISSPELEWQKITALGVILVALLAQFFYEQMMYSTTEKTEKDE